MQEKNDAIGRWLLSIPRDDIPCLTQTPEYALFLEAFQKLEFAHRKIINGIGIGIGNGSVNEKEGDANGGQTSRTESSGSSVLGGHGHSHGHSHLHSHSHSYFHSLQRFFDDDMLLRIFEFVNCHTLARLSETCNRFQILCNRSAKQRTSQMHGCCYLKSYMKLLRAKEQTRGIHPEYSSVRIPLMALGSRIRVTDCGDIELNGIYFCTGTNGNGFLFSKPRFCRSESHSQDQQFHDNNNNNNDDDDDDHDDDNDDNGTENDDNLEDMNLDEEDAGNPHFDGDHRRRRRRTEALIASPSEEIFADSGLDRFPRCIISKRYSESTILWYMSKEVENEMGELKQEYCFWAKIMSMGEVSPEIAKYPSQTSILSRNDQPAWTSLPTTRMVTPPTVELFD